MMIQSIYALKSTAQISTLISEQPDPTLLYKVFIELGIKSMVQYLSFDSRSIKNLLSCEYDKYFDSKFPIFFKNEEGKSGIDVALDMN